MEIEERNVVQSGKGFKTFSKRHSRENSFVF